MLYTDLTIKRAELSSDLLVPHLFAYWVLFRFLCRIVIFWELRLY